MFGRLLKRRSKVSSVSIVVSVYLLPQNLLLDCFRDFGKCITELTNNKQVNLTSSRIKVDTLMVILKCIAA